MGTDEGIQQVIRFTITGNQPRKSNSRQTLKSGKSIKSKSAQDYVKSFMSQSIVLKLQDRDINVPLRMEATVYYDNKLSDLSDELLCDCMEECGLIRNDNLIREKELIWKLDKDNPRAEVVLMPINDYIMDWIPKYKSKAEKAIWKLKKKLKKK